MTRDKLIEECVRLRTITRCYDARNSTSFEEEIACLLRNHFPYDRMSEKDLKVEYQYAKQACEEIG